MTYVIHDVRADGSCFYRAVYNVLYMYGYIMPFCSYIFKQEIHDEDTFVSEIRAYISQMIATKKDKHHIQGIFEKLRADDDDTYTFILEGLPSWFANKFPKRPTNEDTFRETIAKCILSKSAWASQIDIPIMLRLFRRCFKGAITLHIVNSVNGKAPKTFKPETNKLYLLNLDETHYNYIVPRHIRPCDVSKIRNPASRRCVRIEGRVGRKVLKVTDTSSS